MGQVIYHPGIIAVSAIDEVSFTVADIADPTSVVAVNEPIFLQAAPIVTAINAVPSSPGSLSVGERVTFTLNIDTAVRLRRPDLAAEQRGIATFDAAASTGTSLVFDYTVTAGQDMADLLVTSLALNGATIAAPGTSISPALPRRVIALRRLRRRISTGTASSTSLPPVSVGFSAAGRWHRRVQEMHCLLRVGGDPFWWHTGDLNGDGKLDVVVVNFRAAFLVQLTDGTGGFGAATSYAAGGMPRSVVTADVNGDGNPEILIARPLAVSMRPLRRCRCSAGRWHRRVRAQPSPTRRRSAIFESLRGCKRGRQARSRRR